jgi:hypothetical protein
VAGMVPCEDRVKPMESELTISSVLGEVGNCDSMNPSAGAGSPSDDSIARRLGQGAVPLSQRASLLETMSMESHLGPQFDICFPPATSSPVVQDDLRLRQWLYSWLPTGTRTSQWKTIDGWRIPRFVEMTYPICNGPEDARLLVGWITWLHLFDDEFDRPGISHDPDAAEALIAPYLQCIVALRSGQPSCGLLANDLFTMFVELNEKTIAPMSPEWRNRWFDDLLSYVGSYVVETVNRAEGIILAPVELLQLKRSCMAQRTVIDLIERVATGELSPPVFALVSPVIDIVSDITGSVNDPISLARERSRGDTHNMIISLMHHRSMSESEAVAYVVDFVRARCQDLADVSRTIPNDPIVGAEREKVATWLTSCRQWARGYHDWLFETRRYKLMASMSGAHPVAEPVA